MRPTKLQFLGLATIAALVSISLAIVVGPVLSADVRESARAAANVAEAVPAPKAKPLHYVTPVLGATGTVTVRTRVL